MTKKSANKLFRSVTVVALIFAGFCSTVRGISDGEIIGGGKILTLTSSADVVLEAPVWTMIVVGAACFLAGRRRLRRTSSFGHL
jgi:hypothetical protein